MAARRFVFTGKQEVFLEEFELPVLKENEVLVKAHCSLMSTGTENIVFNRLFEGGTGWEDWVKYPFHPGYLAVGEIEVVGGAVTTRAVGDRVAIRASHASHIIADSERTFPIPDALAYGEAVWFGLGKIAYMGAQVSHYHLGDSLLVVGAGPIGQMTVRWAAAAGLEHVVVIDPLESRLALAVRGGATAAINSSVDDCRDAVQDATGGKIPRIINDTTGNAAVFASVLGLAPDFGRIVVLGDTGLPSTQHLTHDLLRKGLTIAGAHDMHNTERWNDATITAFLFSLSVRGRFDLGGLTSHVFKPGEVVEAYRLANTRRGETMGIVFDWSN
jgi:2-desacetyl-2-hydroxyethyl bacteriochlorophyllide A dehydrogenase